MPRDCPVCKKESTCCNSTEKPRKYKKKPLKCPTYECMDVPNNMMLDMDGPPNAANGLNVDLDGDVEVHKAVFKSKGPGNIPIEDCHTPHCRYPPCSHTPCSRRKAPWDHTHSKTHHRDGEKVRIRPKPLRKGYYEFDPPHKR